MAYPPTDAQRPTYWKIFHYYSKRFHESRVIAFSVGKRRTTNKIRVWQNRGSSFYFFKQQTFYFSQEETPVFTGALATGALVTGALVTGALATGALATGALATGALATGALATGALATGALGPGDGGDGDGGGDDDDGGRICPPPPAPVLSCTGIQYPVRLPPHPDQCLVAGSLVIEHLALWSSLHR